MTAKEIMTQLQAMGSESIKKILLNHGVKEPLFGVKVEQLKTIQKKVKVDYQLALELYETGNADAMYLAGLIADDEKMTRADLNTWVKQALSPNISEYTVPWVASGNKLGWSLGLEWIDSSKEHIAAAGWATLAGWVTINPDPTLDLPALEKLLQHVIKTIRSEKDRVKHAMNGFIIAVGCYVVPLSKTALDTAKQIGIVTTQKGDSLSKLPDAASYILKMKEKGKIGKKKKTVKC